VERQRRRRQSLLQRLVDHVFGIRLLLAATASTAALVAVNRFEPCRDRGFARGCLWQDAGGVVTVCNLEAFIIMTAAFLYILEDGKRRDREHLAAHEVILTCQQAGVRFAPARNESLELHRPRPDPDPRCLLAWGEPFGQHAAGGRSAHRLPPGRP
jgi:hypothetical protein